jgi:predicted ATP-grasp superfamily ATP-dependent carboligase
MHFFLYEWVTGGGLVEELSPLPASLLAEGQAMLTALAADFAALPDAHVTVLKDARLDAFPLQRCRTVEINSRREHQGEIARWAERADYCVVIAPEFDGLLRRTAQMVCEAGGKLLGPGDEFIALAANKHNTAQRLASAGVPVPQAVLLEADQEDLPKDFNYPAVLKPLEGAGSQHTYLVDSHLDQPPPYPWPRRLEEYHPGTAASVAVLCGPGVVIPLAPCRQHLSRDSRFTYLGGSLLWETDLAQRATRLAERALAALPAALGYMGIDLVLGQADDGSQDVVIEVNPRLTTSYVGLRAMTDHNLAGAILQAAHGELPEIEFRRDPLEFSVSGAVRRPW